MFNSAEHAHKCYKDNDCVILTFISMINTTFESLKQDFFLFFSILTSVEFVLKLVEHMKFYNLKARSVLC